MEKIRQPAVAGQFYDANPASLKQTISYLVESLPGDIQDKAGISDELVRALVLPHAGYAYSARTAIAALMTVRDFSAYRRIIILAPSHRVAFRGIACPDYDVFRTPSGDMAVDLDALAELALLLPGLTVVSNEPHDNEHSLEVELPLLQYFAGNKDIIPLVCGQLGLEDAIKIGTALRKLMTKDTLLVISSDFTHYGHNFRYVPFTKDIKNNIRNLDMGAIDCILKCDLEGFSKYLDHTGATICGHCPLMIGITALAPEKLKGVLVNYANSGDLSGDWSHCVSYAGISFF